MSLAPERFDEFFHAVYGYCRFPWQSRLARELAQNRWPDCIDLPTASGKTSVIDIAVFTLACQATREPKDRTIGRRVFFTVNRRVIVDEAYDRAVKLAAALKDAKDGILREVADALRAIGGDDELPLDVVQMRGGVYRDASWARNLVQPTIICTTADQLGSRLLFRGYGVSPGMQPIHAALCACDSVILLDEAHVTKAFAQTLRLVTRYQQHKPGLRFVEMTATPSAKPKFRFALDESDLSHPVISKRQLASKPAALAKVNAKSLVAELVKHATAAVNEQRKAIGVIVNRVQTARDVYDQLRIKHPDATHLVIGRMRPIDRDALQEQLRSLVGPDRPDVLEKPVFVVATQCLEVGADFDFDALITECASIDALRQRFGRLNRKGREIAAVANIVTTDAALKDEDPVYGTALNATWDWLTADGRTTIDFGIRAFASLWDGLDQAQRDAMTYVTLDAAVLLPAHLDALCQTNPQPVPSPDVSYFIHGPQRDNAEVSICWRADLRPDNTNLWADIVALLPPTAPECMTVPIRAVRRWMSNDDSPVDADVPQQADETARQSTDQPRVVLRWRGAADAEPIDDPNNLRPGDLLVIPASDSSSRILGHLPEREDGTIEDLAEQAVAEARRQCVVRVHPTVHPELHEQFKGYLDGSEGLTRAGIRERLREHLRTLNASFSAGPAEVPYPDESGVVFRFNALLPAKSQQWKQRELVTDDGEDSSSDSTEPLPLAKHVADVVSATRSNLQQLAVPLFDSTLLAAAAHHDVGKADLRFTAMLAGVSPYELLGRPPLAKSGTRGESRQERADRRARALLPEHFRHEMLSSQFVDHYYDRLITDASVDRELLLHLIAAHHGHARPFAPVCMDQPGDDQLLDLTIDGITLDGSTRKALIPAHRLDSGVAERFWSLTRKHGWWGLAYLEAILRLADQQASAIEQEAGDRHAKKETSP